MTRDALRQLKTLAEAATPGPRTVEPHHGQCHDSMGALARGFRVPELDTVGDGECSAMWKADAEFVAALNPAVVLELVDSLLAALTPAGETEPSVVPEPGTSAAIEMASAGCQHCGGRGWYEGPSEHHPNCDGECHECPDQSQVRCDCENGQ